MNNSAGFARQLRARTKGRTDRTGADGELAQQPHTVHLHLVSRPSSNLSYTALTTQVRAEFRDLNHVLDGRQEAHLRPSKTRAPQRRLVITHFSFPSIIRILFPYRLHPFPFLSPEFR